METLSFRILLRPFFIPFVPFFSEIHSPNIKLPILLWLSVIMHKLTPYMQTNVVNQHLSKTSP